MYPSLSNYRNDKDELVHHDLSEEEKINDIIEEIMVNYGPDGHTDGSWVITRFVVKLLKSNNRKELLKSINFDDFIDDEKSEF